MVSYGLRGDRTVSFSPPADPPGHHGRRCADNTCTATTCRCPFNKVDGLDFLLTGLDFFATGSSACWTSGLDWASLPHHPPPKSRMVSCRPSGLPTPASPRSIPQRGRGGLGSARGKLSTGGCFIAPHAPVFLQCDPPAPDLTSRPPARWKSQYRRLVGVAADYSASSAGLMFPRYPRFEAGLMPPRPAQHPQRVLESFGEWPRTTGSRLITRLAVVMEDPRQLLSGAVTDYSHRAGPHRQ